MLWKKEKFFLNVYREESKKKPSKNCISVISFRTKDRNIVRRGIPKGDSAMNGRRRDHE